MHNRYAKLASWVYELDKPIGRSFGDLEYYQNRLESCNGAILEPAVGNGRIFVPLLEAGFTMQGFDASQEMLDYCRKACQARNLAANLTQQTFESFSYQEKFCAIIIPAGSFQLITDTMSAMATLQRFYSHLAPHGKIIIDLDPIGSFFLPSSMRKWTTDDGNLLTLSDQRVETDYIAQTTLTHLDYQHWRNEVLQQTELDLFKLRWWGVNEFYLALQSTGFTDITISGDYHHGQSPHKNSKIITFEAYRSA